MLRFRPRVLRFHLRMFRFWLRMLCFRAFFMLRGSVFGFDCFVFDPTIFQSLKFYASFIWNNSLIFQKHMFQNWHVLPSAKTLNNQLAVHLMQSNLQWRINKTDIITRKPILTLKPIHNHLRVIYLWKLRIVGNTWRRLFCASNIRKGRGIVVLVF